MELDEEHKEESDRQILTAHQIERKKRRRTTYSLTRYLFEFQ